MNFNKIDPFFTSRQNTQNICANPSNNINMNWQFNDSVNKDSVITSLF